MYALGNAAGGREMYRRLFDRRGPSPLPSPLLRLWPHWCQSMGVLPPGAAAFGGGDGGGAGVIPCLDHLGKHGEIPPLSWASRHSS